MAILRRRLQFGTVRSRKGAFTGANTRSAGRFEQAEGGTLFLDEIVTCRRQADAASARAATGRVHHGWPLQCIKADVRIIAATNKDLRCLSQGVREDSFFAPRGAVARAAARAHRRHSRSHPGTLGPARRTAAEDSDQAALDRLKRHRWPGNVRELENLARRLAALYPQEMITAAVDHAELSQPVLIAAPGRGGADDNLSSAVERYLARYLPGSTTARPAARPLPPHPARGRGPVALRCADGDPRQPDLRRRSSRRQPHTLRKIFADLEIQVYGTSAD